MPARTPKPQLESQHFTTNPPAIQQRLDACLAIDSAHIFQGGPSSPAVAVIQAALNQISDKIDARVPKVTDPPGTFGDSTRDSVHIYKSTRDIVRQGMPLDDIVGRSTISFLDDDMVEIERVVPKPPAPVRNFRDVVVQILGFGGANSSAQGQQMKSDVLRASVASDVYNNKSNRSLEVIKFTGGQQPDPTQQIAKLVRGAILSSGDAVGFVCLTGESAGGKNVLKLANELANSAPQIPLRYVGISDGAFFDEDAVAKPNGAANNLLIKSPFFGGEKLNIFQSAGNGTEFSVSLLRDIWAGKMPNKEVHGPIQGFKPNDRDLTAEGKILPVPNANFETLHANAAAIANTIHLDNIRAILDGAP